MSIFTSDDICTYTYSTIVLMNNYICEIYVPFYDNYFVGFKLIFLSIHKSRAALSRPSLSCISYNLNKISVVNNSGSAFRRQGT